MRIERRAKAWKRFPKNAGSRNWPKCRLEYAPQCRGAPCLRGAARCPEGRRRTPADTAGARRLPGGTFRRLRGLECSRASLLDEFRFQEFFGGRLAIQNAVVQHDGLK